jgi:hypothetical protein
MIVVLENDLLNDRVPESENGPCRFLVEFEIPALGIRLERAPFDVYAEDGTFAAWSGHDDNKHNNLQCRQHFGL